MRWGGGDAGGGTRPGVGRAAQWTLLALITDGEEAGLMGAAGLVTDSEVMKRLRAYINLESIGSAGTSVLFETGPDNGWLVKPWARRAPHPRGGSYHDRGLHPPAERYRLLDPQDARHPWTELRRDRRQLLVSHRSRHPERLSRETIRTTGENVVSIAAALQTTDITARSTQPAVFFDIGGTVGVSYGSTMQWLIPALALISGIVAWVRVSGDAIRTNGVLRWVLTMAWGWLGGIFVGASMAGATWLLRFGREVYHPWYAHPGRLFILLIVTGITIGWAMARLGRWLPARSHPARHPALTWSVALPIWIALAAACLWFAPSAAYLWVLPLLTAGILLSIVPPHNDALVRSRQSSCWASRPRCGCGRRETSRISSSPSSAGCRSSRRSSSMPRCSASPVS